MPKLAIVRHGAAVPGGDSDASRALTEQGQLQADAAGAWLSQHMPGAGILVSPYLRAQQTAAALVRHGLGQGEGHTSGLVTSDALTPSGHPERIVESLLLRTDDLILVSHLPLVGRLAALLVDGQVYDQPWSTAECWVLEGDVFAAGCLSLVTSWYPALER